MSTLPQRLQLHARVTPTSLFCTFLARGNAETITFSELYERSLIYAHAYAAAGVRRGDIVPVILKHSPHLFYAYLGAMLAGAIPTFMPFPSAKQRADLYWQDHAKLFERLAPRLVVSYRENLDACRASGLLDSPATFEAGDHVLLGVAAAEHELPEASGDDLACLQHSSGTTSLKKGVMLTHRAILTQVAAYSEALDFTQRDVIASWLPLYHDMGFIACFMTTIVEGSHLVALDPFEWTMRPSLILDAIATYRATFCWMPNFAFSHTVNGTRPESSYDLSSIRAFVNCSEPCKDQAFVRFSERFGSCGASRDKLQVCYAMAENVFAVTQTRLGNPVTVLPVDLPALSIGSVTRAPSGSPISLVSCGVPIRGVSLEIRDAAGAPVSEGTVGEICLSSPFLFEGYFRLPDKTERALRNGWYSSGDLGALVGGELFITGRVDDMLIVNGRNYYAHEIEAVVDDVPSVLPGRNIALPIDDTASGSTVLVVLAECLPDAESAAVTREIRSRISERLGLDIHRVSLLERGRLLKSTSGKISRAKNKELFLQGALS